MTLQQIKDELDKLTLEELQKDAQYFDSYLDEPMPIKKIEKDFNRDNSGKIVFIGEE